jgi:hypothetical protein
MDNAWGLVIGIANYRTVSSLPPAVLNDAQDVAELLADQRVCAYPPDHVRLILDKDATQQAMRAAFQDLAAATDAESTVFIYYSGHGGRIEAGPAAGEYLVPVDVDAATPEGLAGSAISAEEFTGALRSIAARRLVIVLDCCHAGGIGQVKSALASALKSGLSDSYLEILARGRGRAMLAASRSSEYSFVNPAARNSVFTQHLLAGLRGGVGGEDGFVRIFDLFEYIQPRVTGEQPQQHPIFKGELEENFPVALHLGGVTEEAPKREAEFAYDAYISYADGPEDANWVWSVLVPRLQSAGLQIAVSGDVEEPGVARLVNIERGIQKARRTVIVVSRNYLTDGYAKFEAVLAQTVGVQEGRYRLLPVQIEQLEAGLVPLRLSMLTTLHFEHPVRAAREMDRLIDALRSSLPPIGP